MPRKDASTPISAKAQQDLISSGIEEFELPKSIVTRIARSAIPDNAKLQKETITSLLKGSTVFVNYLAASSHDVALSKQHKTIAAADVLRALEILELGDLVDGLTTELGVWRELNKTDKSKKPAAPAAKAKATAKSVGAAPKIKIKPLAKPAISTPLPTTSEADESISVAAPTPLLDGGVSPNPEGTQGTVDEEMLAEDGAEPLKDNLAVDEAELHKDTNALEGENKMVVDDS
ncbi:histone-fold-containing protein [Cylindrobasidium torrendii FP15055 ss-10]|uniref:DNA polymerase epsilon subunit D n=1 Tax=Cylindrobasidium torrendii FP15055 ss-10 TaxID=1314674 RepID=A0A0D7BRV4_9AGAR|nr:histone-fold-containing protein [Cylindrobasidium torrendii FP15055 ss-10]